jgi:hypothetical protein
MIVIMIVIMIDEYYDCDGYCGLLIMIVIMIDECYGEYYDYELRLMSVMMSIMIMITIDEYCG